MDAVTKTPSDKVGGEGVGVDDVNDEILTEEQPGDVGDVDDVDDVGDGDGDGDDVDDGFGLETIYDGRKEKFSHINNDDLTGLGGVDEGVDEGVDGAVADGGDVKTILMNYKTMEWSTGYFI